MPNTKFARTSGERDAEKRFERMRANMTPEEKARLRRAQNWFTNTKPEIDRRADKYKR